MTKTIADAMYDPKLFGPWFAPAANWRRWEIVIRALFALPIPQKDRAFFHKIFGNRNIPTTQASESLIIAPRGSGKTQVIAMIVTFLAAFGPWPTNRKIRVLVLAGDKEQAGEAVDFIQHFTTDSDALASLVRSRTKSSVTFKNGVRLSIRAATERGIRGPSCAAGICDELPSWLPVKAQKVLRAFRPALAKVNGSMLLHIGTTGERVGPAYEMHEKFFGVNNAAVLVAHAELTDLNITPEYKQTIAKAYATDPYSAAAEYGSAWLSDESSFIVRERVKVGDQANPEPSRTGRIFCGLDPSGGAEKGDQFASACSWVVNGRIKVGMVEHRAGRRDPVETATEFAMLLKPYANRLTIVSDAYAGAYVPALFRRHGLMIYPPHKRARIDGTGRMSQSDYFIAMLGRLNVIDWPNHPALLKELFELVRTPEGAGHAAGKHDDIIGAAARAIHSAALYLDAQTVYDDLPEPEDGDDLGRAPDDDPAPPPGSMAERLERGNETRYDLLGRHV